MYEQPLKDGTKVLINMFYIINYWAWWILSWPDLILERIVLLFVSKTLIKNLLEALFHLMFHLMTHLGKYQNKIGRSNGIYTVILQSSAYLSNNKEVINNDSRELTRDRRLKNRAIKQNAFLWNNFVIFVILKFQYKTLSRNTKTPSWLSGIHGQSGLLGDGPSHTQFRKIYR